MIRQIGVCRGANITNIEKIWRILIFYQIRHTILPETIKFDISLRQAEQKLGDVPREYRVCCYFKTNLFQQYMLFWFVVWRFQKYYRIRHIFALKIFSVLCKKICFSFFPCFKMYNYSLSKYIYTLNEWAARQTLIYQDLNKSRLLIWFWRFRKFWPI